MRPHFSCPAARFAGARSGDARARGGVPAARTERSGGLLVWLPWLCAPGFALLPIAGCGLAGTLKDPASTASVTSVATKPGAGQPLVPGPRDPRLVRIGAVMPSVLPRR
jgi:hypothetical protein